MSALNTRNRFDNKDSLGLGERAENLFRKTALGLGWQVLSASKDENINEHWDFQISKDEVTYKVEVKSRKRISRGDVEPQLNYTWIEIHGVRPGDTGWLFGKADLIAFEKEKSFLLVKKADLLTLVNKKVDLVAKVNDPKEALYKIYKRTGRKDKLTLLPTADIEEIKFGEWIMENEN